MWQVKMCLERKKFPSVTRRCRPVVNRNWYRRLKGCRFEILATPRQLGWIDAPHTQNFEISKSAWVEARELKFCMNMLC
jgi:hypothetical protein